VIQWFAIELLGLIGYQLVGVAVFLPLELAFPKAEASVFQRLNGIIFLIITAVLVALASLAMVSLRSALHIETLVSFKSDFGGPVLAAFALALWTDFQFYVLHRLEHRFLWRFHAVHHSIRNLSAANSYHHWTEAIWLTFAAIPFMFIDVNIGPTLGWLTFIFHYQQFYIHTSAKPHFGPFRWLLIDNRYHRIHHSTRPEHHDKNFGAMTPLWDWLFGTLHMPKSHEWPDVGLPDMSEPQGLKDWSRAPWDYPMHATNMEANSSRSAG
jgi:sterol desaturase/sphingolipid hydroxylase (fatty acid hydroxylase superfamily)